MKRKSTKQTPSYLTPDIKAEIAAFFCFLVALFTYLTLKKPEASGLVGHWVFSVGLQNLIGSGLSALPVFLGLAGISLLLPFSKKKPALICLGIGFADLLIYLELITYKSAQALSWPIQLEGGGMVGVLGNFLLQKAIGYQGTWIVLVGTLLISLILAFNFSIIASLKSFTHFIKTNKHSHSFFTLLKLALFYAKKKSNTIKKPSRRKKTSTKSKQAEISEFILPDLTGPSAEALAKEDQLTPEPLIPETQIKEPTLSPLSRKKIKAQDDSNFILPPIDLLAPGTQSKINSPEAQQHRQMLAETLEAALQSFNVDAKVVNITPGPSVTRYELQPGVGVKISKITALSKDIALQLSAPDVRIEAPIPGKALVGIEVPNAQTDIITLRMLLSEGFYDDPSRLLTAMGLTITGDTVYMDLGKMPHVLIAGATGSGKSVCINTIILSILMKTTPGEVKFLMIDPKKVELSLYEGIPHLVAPVVTNPHKAAATLKEWALTEMETRYDTFARIGVKDIGGYNKKMVELKEGLKKSPDEAKQEIHSLFNLQNETEEEIDYETTIQKIPYLVVIIDELADLMMVASQDVENTICRLAQMARATGIHLVIATQRPSVNVVTGLIKANVPSRISFFLQSQIDSRTIIDTPGAEKLLGKGDMLYLPVGAFKPGRLQGVFVSEKEVKAVVKHLKTQGSPDYDMSIEEIEPLKEDSKDSSGDSNDDMYEQAAELVKNTQYASTSYLQRKLRIGYNRAARLMDELEDNGVISKFDGEKKSRTVL